MHITGRFGSRLFAVVCAASFVALVGAGLGCSNSSNNTPSGNSFYGMYADQSGVPGTIALNAVALDTVPFRLGGGASTPLTGKLDLAGQAPIDLSGLYFTDTGVLSFSSTGDTYTFNGQVAGAAATGSSTGPNGPGSFVLLTGGTAATVAIFCGTGVCTAPPGCKASAAFNLAISGPTAALTVYVNGTVVPVVGTRMGDNVSFHITAEGTDVTINGVINGVNVGGTWSDNLDGVSGTWNGSTAQCSATAR